ncbi:MAG: A/G-specific adenine glycosylase [Actinobacteria bacterium]|nr:MAG: A/G-specific adenine glycosylase [Actinomycetota bacterium]
MMGRTLDAERNLALLAWYGDRKRFLPWRNAPGPYGVLVSEFMLQQTQAARVGPYYEQFLARFPTIEALAEAPLADVLEAWSGLGYNSRAMRLREAARQIVTEGWPSDVVGLQELPGVGPYTAAAIASLAFGMRVPAIDTNLRRVLSRWYGESLDGPLLRSAAEAALADDAGAWNQAMMDLGATTCRPRNPRCEECPVEEWCSGPQAYVSPHPQARFEGSARQLRGAIVRAVVRGPQSFEDLRRGTGFTTEEIELALDDLEDEGLIVETEDGDFIVAD